MSKRLSAKKLDSMFKAYCEKQSLQFIARKFSVSRPTVLKYKRLQDWDGRLKGIQQKAREKQDDSLAQSLADNLKIVNFAKGKVLKLMQGDKEIMSRNPVSDLDKMIRLELLLRGEVDSRTGIKLDSKLKDISTVELLKMQKKLGKGYSDE